MGLPPALKIHWLSMSLESQNQKRTTLNASKRTDFNTWLLEVGRVKNKEIHRSCFVVSCIHSLKFIFLIIENINSFVILSLFVNFYLIEISF